MGILVYLLLSANFLLAQTITGIITDENGEPLPNANIIVEGTAIGVSSTFDGSYSINLPDGSGPFTIKVSFVGYQPLTKQVDAKSQTVDFQLNPSVEELLTIVVTAENRQVNAQEVPISMDLISGPMLIKQGATDLTQLQNLAPGLNIVENTVFTQITVRGVGSHDGAAEMSDQAILIGVDGEYINRPVALNATLFDIERLEVLKGPQGTLYGRNATAGAVNIIANKPKLETKEAELSATYGNYNTVKLNGSLNLPMGKTAAVRLAAMLNKHDGYRDGGPAGKLDDGNVWAARLGLTFKPVEALSIYVAGEYNKTDQTARSQYGVNVAADVPTLNGQIPSNWTTDLPDEYDLADAGFLEIEQTAVRANISYDFGIATLAYKGGYRYIDMYGYQPLTGYVPEAYTYDNGLVYKTNSHEILLKGEMEKFVWQTGYFYGDEDQEVARGLVLPGVAGLFDGELPYLNFTVYDVSSTTNGIFAQATYKLTEKLGLTGGIRYTKDEKSRTGSQLTTAPFGPPGTPAYFYPNHPEVSDTGMTPNPGAGEWDQVTWLANLDYQIDEDKMIFAKVSTGYKAGGFDNLGSYDPEKITAFEIGSKNKFMNNRFRLNGSIFHYNYDDQQVKVFINTEVGDATKNAASTEVFGVELDGEMLVTPTDHLKLTVNYLNAEFGEFPALANVVGAEPIEVNLEGNKPIQSPEWTIIAGYNHDFMVGSGILNVGIQTMFKSEYYLTAFNWDMDKQDAYTKTDFSVTYMPSGNWDVRAFVHNIEDNRAIQYSAFTGDGIDAYNWVFGTPRTFGTQVNYYF
jgi:iron complex outermembrane receptor protein